MNQLPGTPIDLPKKDTNLYSDITKLIFRPPCKPLGSCQVASSSSLYREKPASRVWVKQTTLRRLPPRQGSMGWGMMGEILGRHRIESMRNRFLVYWAPRNPRHHEMKLLLLILNHCLLVFTRKYTFPGSLRILSIHSMGGVLGIGDHLKGVAFYRKTTGWGPQFRETPVWLC